MKNRIGRGTRKRLADERLTAPFHRIVKVLFSVLISGGLVLIISSEVVAQSLWTKRNEVINDANSGHVYSHPMPFELDNGDLIVGFTTNESSSSFDIKLLRSTNGGQTWGSKVTVASTSNNIYEGSFAQTSSSNLVIVYGDGDGVAAKRSSNRGSSWGGTITIAPSGGGEDTHPSIARASNGTLICAYNYKKNILGKISTDGGAHWGSSFTIADHPTRTYRSPSIITEPNGDLVVAFQDDPGASLLIDEMITRSINGGASWSAPTLAKPGVFDVTNDPNLTRLNNGDLVMWFDVGLVGTRTANFILSHDEGQTWTCGDTVYNDGDPHRINGIQRANGSMVLMCASLDAGDNNYHIDSLTPPAGWPTSVPGCGAVPPSCITPPPGMVGWWPGDGDATDLVGVDNGLLLNGATFTTGEVLEAFSFDGVNSTVTMPATALHNAFSALTIDAWVYPLSNAADTSGNYGRTIVSNTDNDGFALRIRNGFVQADLRLSSGDVLSTFSQTLLPLNAWSHVALTYDGTQVTAYINGQAIGNVPATGTIRNSQNASTCLMIGNEPFSSSVQSGNFGWPGRIDEVEIFNRALSSTEIASIYAAGSAGKCKNVIPPTDGTPPSTSSTVTVTLSAIDSAGGSGVKQISYSATGAQPIPLTTVSGSSVDITLSAQGTTTITFFATDNSGNNESPKSIMIDLPLSASVTARGSVNTSASLRVGVTPSNGVRH